MTGKTWSIASTFLLSFAISAGGAYMSIATNGTIPSTGAIVAALVTGVVAAAQATSKLLQPPPT